MAVLASSLADGVADCVGGGGQKEFPNLKKAREILDAVKFEAEVRQRHGSWWVGAGGWELVGGGRVGNGLKKARERVRGRGEAAAW